MSSNIPDPTIPAPNVKTLRNEVKKAPVIDVSSERHKKKEQREKDGWLWKRAVEYIAEVVEKVGVAVWLTDSREERAKQEKIEEANNLKKLKKILWDIPENISIWYEEITVDYERDLEMLERKNEESWKVSPEISEKISNIKNKLRIFQVLQKNINKTLELELKFLIDNIRIPSNKLQNIITDNLFYAIEEQFSFEDGQSWINIPKEELITKWNNTLVAAITNIRIEFGELLTNRLPWDYQRLEAEYSSNSISLLAKTWWNIYYSATSLCEQEWKIAIDILNDSEECKQKISNCIKYACVFLSPEKAKEMIQEISKISSLRKDINKDVNSYLPDFEKWSNNIKVIDYINKNIISLLKNWRPDWVIWEPLDIKSEKINNIRSSLIFHYQKIKCELMNWEDIVITLWKIITIYEQNDWDNEIDEILWLFESVRFKDIKKIREIKNNYLETIEPKKIHIELKKETRLISLAELITIRGWDDKHLKYRELIDRIKQIPFIGEVWNRLHWSSFLSCLSNIHHDIILSRIKKKGLKNAIDILSWEIIKTSISPDKKHLAILIKETTKDKWTIKTSHNIHIVNIKEWFVERSHYWLSMKWNLGSVDLNFLENMDTSSEQNIYLSDEVNFYLLWWIKPEIWEKWEWSENRKLFNTSDAFVTWEKDQWVDITDWHKISISRIDPSGNYLYRFYNTFIRSSEANGQKTQKWLYWNPNPKWNEQSKLATEARTYLSIIWLTDSQVVLKWDLTSFIYPTKFNEDYLLPFLQQENALYISKTWKYMVILFESEKNWNKIYIYEVKNNDWDVEISSNEINNSSLLIRSKIKSVSFSQDENEMYILHDEWDITIYSLALKKPIRKIFAKNIKGAFSGLEDIKIYKMSIDPTWEYASVNCHSDWKYLIGIINLITWEIKPLNIEEKIKSERSSMSSCSIINLNKNIKLVYNQNWSIFKLEFSWQISKSIDISDIFYKIGLYKIEDDKYKKLVVRNRPNNIETLRSEAISGKKLEIIFNHTTKNLQINLGAVAILTHSLKATIWEISDNRWDTSEKKSWITSFDFSSDWLELLYWTSDGKYWIIWRRVINSLFRKDIKEV